MDFAELTARVMAEGPPPPVVPPCPRCGRLEVMAFGLTSVRASSLTGRVCYLCGHTWEAAAADAS
jgi:hypothetical protein